MMPEASGKIGYIFRKVHYQPLQYGQSEKRGGSVPFFTLNPDCSAVLLHDMLADIQSKSGAGILTAAGFLFLAVPLKNPRKPLRIDTCTGVLHTDCNIGTLPPCRYGNQTIYRKTYRIGNQIDDDL